MSGYPRGYNLLPRVRWVHIGADGVEQNFDTEPSHVKTFRVRIIRQTASEIEEDAVTADTKDREPNPPPGNWLVMQRRRDGRTTWWRRRYL